MVLFWHLPGGTKENHKKSVGIADSPGYCYTSLHVGFYCQGVSYVIRMFLHSSYRINERNM
jgi:hypothetical protein